jgi:hypothetical protein
MTVGEPIVLPPAPVEVDILAKTHSVNHSEEEEVKNVNRKNAKQEKNCLLAISTLACLLLVIVLVSVLLFIPFAGNSQILAEEFPITYNDRNLVLGDLQPQTVEYMTFNLSSVELAEGANPSFYGCLHSASLEVFACISQGTIPSYSDCENLLISDYYDYEDGKVEETGFLNGYALLPRCGVNVITLPEFELCNLNENIWISVFNADYYNSRAYEVTVNYADCTECSDSTYQCIPNPFLLATSAILLILLASLMCCASLLVICRAPKEEETETESESDS